MAHEVPIPVLDIFAGPGGLGEGFSALGRDQGTSRFKIALSIEKDPTAHKTLELRAFFRQFDPGDVPEDYYDFLRGRITRADLFDRTRPAANSAEKEAMLAELGKTPSAKIHRAISDALCHAKQWVLIGGPPCQAYSSAGRSRNKNKKDYVAEDDHRQYLYKEYLQIIADHWPSVFVMENVKGLLSATLQNQRIFDRILNDLHDPATALSREGRAPSGKGRQHRYRVYSLVQEGLFGDSGVDDFVVRAEQYGIPQARHRLILMGVRDDVKGSPGQLQPAKKAVFAGRVLQGLPALRSGLSREKDEPATWLARVRESLDRRWLSSAEKMGGDEVVDLVTRTVQALELPPDGRGDEWVPCKPGVGYRPDWFLDPRLNGVCNHHTKQHMVSDLHRYLYAACYAQIHHRSPNLRNFPKDLLPDHENVADCLEDGGLFGDRFRVQLSTRPSTTITCHLAKDGHYYIHPDPAQCRSLTVREAARLQTFPDNYFFCGGRTAQYAQVGNAVPPLLAHQIAQIVHDVLA